MNHQESRVILHIARYGLPIIILLFYLTASLEFNYTPESTYHFLAVAGDPSLARGADASPSPLWQFFIAPASWFSLDAVRWAKVLAMLCSSIGIVCLYLLAVELGGDRLIALLAALPVALHPWMLQVGPAGSALSIALPLSLTVLWLMKRGRPLLAALFAGLSTLVLWQAVGLLAVLLSDLFAVSGHSPRSRQRTMALVLGFGAGLLPWAAYAGLNHLPFHPVVLSLGEIPPPSIFEIVVLLLLLGIAAGGLLLASTRVRSERGVAQDGLSIWLWMVWLLAAAVFGGSELAFLGIPLLLVYALLGVRIFLKTFGGERFMYTALVGVCGLMLLQQQMRLGATVRPVMEQTSETTEQLRSAALWLRAHAGPRETVATERPWVVAYLTGMEVHSTDSPQSVDSDFLVTSGATAKGYMLVYRPPFPGRWPAARTVAVWKKQ